MKLHHRYLLGCRLETGSKADVAQRTSSSGSPCHLFVDYFIFQLGMPVASPACTQRVKVC